MYTPYRYAKKWHDLVDNQRERVRYSREINNVRMSFGGITYWIVGDVVDNSGDYKALECNLGKE